MLQRKRDEAAAQDGAEKLLDGVLSDDENAGGSASGYATKDANGYTIITTANKPKIYLVAVYVILLLLQYSYVLTLLRMLLSAPRSSKVLTTFVTPSLAA